MKTSFAALLSAFVLGSAALPAAAVVTPFDLMGRAGAGLLGGNEAPNAAFGGGSGGEIGGGITFDSDLNLLSLSVGWGSLNGFTDLTGNAVAGHIHGPTPTGAPNSFQESFGVLVGLNGFNSSASAGGFTGSFLLDAPQEAALFAGKLYVNIHTAANASGEIRGNLMPVPEPASFAMLGLGLALVAGVVRRRRT